MILTITGYRTVVLAGRPSDNFVDIGALKFEPQFEKFVGDAFSTAGICINDYRETWIAGEQQQIAVCVVNDYPHPISGAIALSMIEGAADATTTTHFETVALGKSTVHFALSAPAQPDHLQLKAELHTMTQRPVCSWRDINVISRAEAGLAYKVRVLASSSLNRVGKKGMDFRQNMLSTPRRAPAGLESHDDEWLTLELPIPASI